MIKLEKILSEMQKEIIELRKRVDILTDIVKDTMPQDTKNKDGIPIGTEIFAEVDKIGTVVLETLPRAYLVKKIGKSEIEDGKRFSSLSASAEAFSQIKRKSGWVFWRDKHGKTLKEVFKG